MSQWYLCHCNLSNDKQHESCGRSGKLVTKCEYETHWHLQYENDLAAYQQKHPDLYYMYCHCMSCSAQQRRIPIKQSTWKRHKKIQTDKDKQAFEKLYNESRLDLSRFVKERREKENRRCLQRFCEMYGVSCDDDFDDDPECLEDEEVFKALEEGAEQDITDVDSDDDFNIYENTQQAKLPEDAMQLLHPQAQPFLTKQLHAFLITNWQTRHKVSNQGVKELLNLLKHIYLPELSKNNPVQLDSVHQLHKILVNSVSDKVFTSYKIPICPRKDCAAWYGILKGRNKENEKKICPKCQAPFFKESKLQQESLNNKQKQQPEIPIKTFRMFSLRAHLLNLFSNAGKRKLLTYASEHGQLRKQARQTVDNMKHKMRTNPQNMTTDELSALKTNSKFLDEMFDLQDSPGWKKFVTDTEFISEKNPQNIVITICTDGINPFKAGNRKQYSMWPIVVLINNYPPHVRHKVQSLFLAGVIPGPKKPKNLYVYMKLLLDEIDLINNGEPFISVPTNNESEEETNINEGPLWIDWDCNFYTPEEQEYNNLTNRRCKRVRVMLLQTVGDYPGQCDMLNHAQAGYYGCFRCLVKAENMDRICSKDGAFEDNEIKSEEKQPEPDNINDRNVPKKNNNQIRKPTKGMVYRYFMRFRTKPYKNVVEKDGFMHRKLARIANVNGKLALGKQHASIFDTLRICCKIDKYPQEQPIYGPEHFPCEVMHLIENTISRIMSLLKGTRKLAKGDRSMTLNSKDKAQVISRLAHMKLPPGIGADIKRALDKIKLKTSDLHHLTYGPLKFALRGVWSDREDGTQLRECLFEFLDILHWLAAKTIRSSELDWLHRRLIDCLSRMEKGLFPQTTFTIAFHTLVHVVDTLKLWGPAKSYWMYPVERYLGFIAREITSRKCPEQSLINTHCRFVSTDLARERFEKALCPDLCSQLSENRKLSGFEYADLASHVDYHFAEVEFTSSTSVNLLKPSCELKNILQRNDIGDELFQSLQRYYRTVYKEYNELHEQFILEAPSRQSQTREEFRRFLYRVEGKVNRYTQRRFFTNPDISPLAEWMSSIYVNKYKYRIRAKEEKLTTTASVVGVPFQMPNENTNVLDTKVFFGQIEFFLVHHVGDGFEADENDVGRDHHYLAYMNWYNVTIDKETKLIRAQKRYAKQKLNEHFVDVRKILGPCAIAQDDNNSEFFFIIPMYHQEMEVNLADEILIDEQKSP